VSAAALVVDSGVRTRFANIVGGIAIATVILLFSGMLAGSKWRR
jgi:MFS superfamily sulfate permease-like transporter